MPLIDNASLGEWLSQPGHGGGDSPQDSRTQDTEDSGKAFERIKRLVSVRERSVEELKARLLREGFTPEGTEEALGRGVTCGLVDDTRFADALIRGRVSAGKGRQGIERELEGLHISPESIPGWPEGFGLGGEEQEVARAVGLLTKRPPTSARPQNSAYQRLVRNGYSSSAAVTAVRIWAEGL